MRLIRRPALVVLLGVATLGGCSPAGGDEARRVDLAGATAEESTTTVPEATTTTSASTTTTTTAAAPPSAARHITEQAYVPFATVGGITLVHPAALVERVGFHQSNHEGAQQMEPLPTAVAPAELESRERLTGSRTAADIVVEPSTVIRSPVTGTVKRAGTYVLYCEHSDDYAVIAPDGQPGWEVKLLHINGVQVRAGQRVIAGETVLAAHATQLPFESQVDELAVEQPAWPHVHVEVVDPSIPNVASPGGGC